MFDQAKNLMIGLFVIAAVTIIIFILLFIHPMVGDEGKILRVRFANIDKVNVGTRVNFGGKPVGEVTEIREIIDEPDPRPEYNGYVYVYELKLAVDSSVNVYNSDDVSLRTSGLLGERTVSITPLPPKKEQELRIINEEIIYADETGTVEDTIKEFKHLSDKIEVALDSIITNLDDITQNKMWEKISDSFSNIRDITGALNKPDEWSDTLKNVNTLSEDILNSWTSVDEAIADGKAIVANVKNGQGSIGKILMSDDLYLRVTSLFNKAQTTMDDVNHYGLLFHLDKNWQRLRARRLNLLQKLRTPQEFRNYFNDEVDQISTSLSRVCMVLNKTGQCEQYPNLVKDYEFTKVFSELLRRVEGVEDQLNMYNTQLQEYNVNETELSEYRCN